MRLGYVTCVLAAGLLVLSPISSLGETAEQAAQERSPRLPKNDFYERAYALRSQRTPTWAEQQKSAELLVAASGFRSREHGRSYPFNGTLPCPEGSGCSDAQEPVTLQGYPGNANISREAHRGALRELAKAFQDGSGVPQDFRLALALFRAASELGDPEAQGHMGLRYSMGLDEPACWSTDGILGFGPPKPQQALLHYYFGALGGDTASRMALGYRHWMGLGVPKSCWTAASYYQPVGEQVSDLAAGTTSRPPWGAAARGSSSSTGASGVSTTDDTTTGGDSAAGGSGAAGSRAGSGVVPPFTGGALPHVERIRLHLQAAQGGLRAERHKEVVQYYQYSADRGNTEAQTAVGQVLNYGTHGIDRDHAAALSYFKLAAEAGDVDAMAHLGSMYANGYGTAQSYAKALEWWSRAAKRHSGVALFGLGYLHLTGRGVEQDYKKAFQYFGKAAEQVHSDARPDAMFYLGVMHLKGFGVPRKSVQRALSYFSLAAQLGQPLAQYNAAVMNLAGKGTTRNCKPAVTMLKVLAEKGPEAAAVQLGHEHFFRGRYGLALLSYLRAADMGFEVAQSNAAWMLERGYVPGNNTAEVSFVLYKQSAAQANVHSLLCMGDAYFYGRGVQQDWVRSAALYYEASQAVSPSSIHSQERSAEAMFNLGFMHEFGVGVPQDLELARRFYNMARHTQADAALPVMLANTWLRLHKWWDWLRPHLPPALDPVWNGVFALHPPHTSLFGPWVARAQRLLPNLALFHAEVLFWRWVDLVGLGSLGALVRLEDASESATLLALLGGLALVVRLRRRRAQARVQQQEAARLLERQLLAQVEAEAARAAAVTGAGAPAEGGVHPQLHVHGHGHWHGRGHGSGGGGRGQAAAVGAPPARDPDGDQVESNGRVGAATGVEGVAGLERRALDGLASGESAAGAAFGSVAAVVADGKGDGAKPDGELAGTGGEVQAGGGGTAPPSGVDGTEQNGERVAAATATAVRD